MRPCRLRSGQTQATAPSNGSPAQALARSTACVCACARAFVCLLRQRGIQGLLLLAERTPGGETTSRAYAHVLAIA